MSEDVRIDPTAVGLLFIGFVLFVVGIFGLQQGNVFGDVSFITGNDLIEMCYLFGFALTLIGIFAYRAGSLFGTGVFLWVAAALFAVSFIGLETGSWFLYIIIAIFFAIFTIWALLAGSPKILVGVLAFATLTFLFLAISLKTLGDAGDAKMMLILTGVFSLLGFILATYLGFALTGAKELKVV